MGQAAKATASYSFSFGGTSAKNFVTVPSSPKMEYASKTAKVKFAAKSTTKAGRYILTTSSSGVTVANAIGTLPDLPVIVKSDKCSVNAAYSNYNIPKGGKSVPVVFDYVNCYPVSDVSLEG